VTPRAPPYPGVRDPHHVGGSLCFSHPNIRNSQIMKTPPDCQLGEALANHGVILTVSLKRALRDQALLEGRSQSEIVRELIRAYLRR
jgi:Ribbon-helix-helix protein, copG family